MEEKPKMYWVKHIAKIMFVLSIIICIAVVLANYLINDEFRNEIDLKIFGKQIDENTLSIVEINSDSKPYISAYSRYISVLSKNVLTIYNQNASVINTLDINITNPCKAVNGQYLVLAENGGQKIYLISDTGIKWSKDLDGEIYRVSVNKNGYVSVLLKNSTYKSVAQIFDENGEELFMTYLVNYAVCSEISENNKYLAIGQIDYTGTVVKSIVKIISIDKIKENSQSSQNSILYTYESESTRILENIKFNDKNEAICMFDTYIQKVTDKNDEKIYKITDDDIFVDINLGNNAIIIKRETSGLFSYKYQMNIKNTVKNTNKLYILENEVPKRIDMLNNFICIKLGNELRIISENGWLIKSCRINNEIQNIVLGDNIIGIVYNNKVEIIDI